LFTFDAIAPLLFNVVLEIAIRKFNTQTYGTIFYRCSQITAHADDVVIMGRRLQDVKEVFTSLDKQTNKMGLEINKKRQFMIVSRKPYNENEYVTLGTCGRLYISWYSSNKIKWIKTRDCKKNYECKQSILCTSSYTKEWISMQSTKNKKTIRH